MRVIYRSASKLRFHSSTKSWIIDAARKASLLLLAKVGGRTLRGFGLNILAWAIFPVCLPLAIFVFCFAWLYSIALIRLVRCLEREAKKVEIITSVGSSQDTDIVTLMFTMEGDPPKEEYVKERINQLIHQARLTQKDGKKLLYQLKTRMGCCVWNKDHNFNLQNHVVIETGLWKGAKIVQDNLRYWLNFSCSNELPSDRPPWKVIVVPYLDRARLQCHAILVRMHRSLMPCFKLSDILVCKATNFELKKAVAEALQFTDSKPQLKTKFEIAADKAKHIYDVARKISWIVWITPKILYTELLESYQYLSPNNLGHENSVNKSLFWSKDVPKDLVVKLKQSLKSSSTGILMSCLAGATRQYRLQTGEEAPDNTFNLMPYYDRDALSVQGLLPNGFRSLPLPVGVVDQIARVQMVHRNLNSSQQLQAKRRISLVVLSHIYFFAPPILVRALTYLISKKYQTIVDNVYVSDSPATLWDKHVTSVLFWRPPSTSIGTTLSFIHYDDKISLSFSAKRRVIQRPDLLVSLVERELYDLALALNIRIERKQSPPASPNRLFKSLSLTSN